MPDFDLLIRGAQPFENVGIADGKFAAFTSGSARQEIDARELRLLPGVIDAHVHFNDPGRAEWEGLATGSQAAALGGITTFFDMPLNAHPPTLDRASFDAKRAAAEAQSVVDFALWGGLTPINLDKLEELRDCGVIGLKAFMSNSGIDDFPSVPPAVLREGMKRAAKLGLVVAVHAESDETTNRLGAAAQQARRTSIRDYLDSRPVSAELEAIRMAIEFSGETGCALHIVHVSCGSGVALIAEARASGINVTCETCPHYLVLTDADMERIGALAKCAPPLRDITEQKGLLDHLRAGHITTVGSDHSPAPASMKSDANFFKVWGGISGVQHLLPLLLDLGLDLDLLAQVTASNVAERFRLAPRKGSLAIGADADFVLADLGAVEIIAAESLQYRHQHSPYVGRRVRGVVQHTFLRGQPVVYNRRLTGSKLGQLIKPNA
jgi:allantoinase